MLKNRPAMQETWVWSLGWEDPLEKGMAIHSSILTWRIPINRGTWQATVHGVTKSCTQLSDSAQHTQSFSNLAAQVTTGETFKSCRPGCTPTPIKSTLNWNQLAFLIFFQMSANLQNSWKVLWTECLCPPKFICWNPNPQCDGNQGVGPLE